MSSLTISILSALAVSCIIAAMARVHSQKLKAILYSLPFPITIALIGSHSIATSLSILGLMLTGSFLWGCYFLHGKLGIKVLYADVLLAVLYVIAAYIFAQSLHVPFWGMFAIFTAAWLVVMALFKRTTFTYHAQALAKTNAWLKAIIVFVIAFALFSAHQYLAAFVVTFPYNGVFAVYENKAGLLPQAALFTRNSLALAAYFLANYLVGAQHAALVRYTVSWLAFGIVLILVNRFVTVRIKDMKLATAK
jgi:hypothetical protein